MAFVKLVKNNAYYKRYQTAYRRRREGKTDYYARKRLITQDKNKYNTAKYRLVIRRTNKQVIAQIIYATLKGDRVFCQARSQELSKYGLTAGLTNYASHYATGLLLARRLLKSLSMDSIYAGAKEVNGENYNVEDEAQDRQPFRAVLDVGLAHTTTGNRIFGCMKGAVDGGLSIPHSDKRFPGYADGEEGEDGQYDAKVHRDRIFGAHVDKYINELKGDADAYKKQFAKWEVCLKKTGSKSVEALYAKVHAEIRKAPEHKKSVTKVTEKKDRKYPINAKKLTKQERQKRIKSKMKKILKGKQ